MKPLLTIFTVPKPFTNPHITMIQENAINSWVHIGQAVDVLLIGDEDGVIEAAKKYSVRQVKEVVCNKYGTPLISSIFKVAREKSTSPLLAYVNADILLTPDFVRVAQNVIGQFKEFLIVGRRWDLELTKPLSFSKRWDDQLDMLVRNKARLHPAGGSDYFIYPRVCYPEIPDLAIGRAGWDNWMIFEARRRCWPVVDASPSYKVIHQQHDYSHLPGGKPHHHLPESDENVRLAGGRHAIYTLQDANWILKNWRVEKVPLNWTKLWREIEILPTTRLNSNTGARVAHIIFHPARTLRQLRVRLSKALSIRKK